MDFTQCMTTTDWFIVLALDVALFVWAYLLGQDNPRVLDDKG